jgi:RND family efflux transporter MFP subunit
MAQCSRSVVVAWLVATLVPAWAPAGARAQAVETVKVMATPAADRVVTLPGELVPFQATAVTARVAGFVEQVHVDRGALVRQGQVLATLATPELVAQTAEALTRVQQAEARKAEADARLVAATSALERVKRASADAAAAKAAVDAQAQAVAGARSAHEAIRVLEQYQRVTAPFAGRIVERLVHPGALVGPSAGALFRLEETSRLRLVVPVPEVSLGVVTTGRMLEFTVPAQPGRTFTARLARSAGSLDGRTRSMMVEADVVNRDGALAPGMFPDVRWPIVRAAAGLMVPTTAVVTTTERTFVIRVAAGKAEWVTVKKGAVAGDQVEVAGALAVGDTIVRRGTDEIRAGASIK